MLTQSNRGEMESFCACPQGVSCPSVRACWGGHEYLLSLGVGLLFLSMRFSYIPIN